MHSDIACVRVYVLRFKVSRYIFGLITLSRRWRVGQYQNNLYIMILYTYNKYITNTRVPT